MCIAYTIFKGKTKEKPEAIHNYNKYMLGVDKVDHAINVLLHKSVRKVFFGWWKCVLLTPTLYSSKLTNNSFSHSQHISFRQKLITSLTEPLLLLKP